MRRLVGAICIAVSVGCTGEVDVWLVDRSAPDEEDALGFEEAELPLDVVEAKRVEGWVALARGPNPYNLLDFSGTSSPVDLVELGEEGARVAHDEVPLGAITALRLRLVPGETFEVEDEHGTDYEIALAGLEDGALEVPVDVEVVGSEPTVVTLGIDVRAALTEVVGGGYTFSPTLTVE